MNYKSYYESEDLKSGIFHYPVGADPDMALIGAGNMTKILRKLYPSDRLFLACRGSSGTIISSMIAALTPIDGIIHIKKENESAHSRGFVSPGRLIGGKIIIVDDFIGTGNTIWNIYSSLISQYSETGIGVTEMHPFKIDALIVSKGIFLEDLNNFDMSIDTLIGEKIIDDDKKHTKVNLNIHEGEQVPLLW